jgi:thioredoxin-like negative regulator of GroEL
MRSKLFVPLLAGLVILISASQSSAQVRSSLQPVEIRGQVRYARGNAPAENVLIRLESLSGGYAGEERTDRLGKFLFARLLPIQYFVTLRHPGYQEIRLEVNLVMISSDYIQLQLVPDEVASNSSNIYSPKVVDASVPLEARREFEKGENALLNSHKLDEAISHYEKAIGIYPKFVQAQLRLGTTYMDIQQWDKAEQVLTQALSIDSKAFNVHFALGTVYLKLNRFDDAEKILKKGLAIENRSWQGHFTLARTYWTRNARDDIYNAARQAALTLQLNYDLAEAHLLAGNIWMRANKQPEALFEFQEYLRLAPKGEFVAQTRETVQKIKSSQKTK